MYFPPEVIAPARRKDESFDDYARRRSIANAAVKRYLQTGIKFYGPEKFLRIHPAGENKDTDEQIRRGNVRILATIDTARESYRIALPKGKPYRKPQEVK